MAATHCPRFLNPAHAVFKSVPAGSSPLDCSLLVSVLSSFVLCSSTLEGELALAALLPCELAAPLPFSIEPWPAPAPAPAGGPPWPRCAKAGAPASAIIAKKERPRHVRFILRFLLSAVSRQVRVRLIVLSKPSEPILSGYLR